MGKIINELVAISRQLKYKAMIWRTKELQLAYEEELKKWKDKCYLCEEAKKFKKGLFYYSHKLVVEKCGYFFKKNDFPYNEVEKKHIIITSLEHNKEVVFDLNLKVVDDFDIIFQNKEKECTIKNHPHIHLIKFKDDLSEEIKNEFIEYVKNNCNLIYLKI